MNEMIGILPRRGFLRGLLGGIVAAPLAAAPVIASSVASASPVGLLTEVLPTSPAAISFDDVDQEFMDLFDRADVLARKYNRAATRCNRALKRYKKIAPVWVDLDLKEWCDSRSEIGGIEKLNGYVTAREERAQQHREAVAAAREKTGLDKPQRAAKRARAKWEAQAALIADTPAKTLPALIMKAEVVGDYPYMADAIVADLLALIPPANDEGGSDV